LGVFFTFFIFETLSSKIVLWIRIASGLEEFMDPNPEVHLDPQP
jgi:hypothetical protein